MLASYNAAHSPLIHPEPRLQVAASIFKAYDIRGIVPSTLTEAVAEAWAVPSAPWRASRAKPWWRWAVTGG